MPVHDFRRNDVCCLTRHASCSVESGDIQVLDYVLSLGIRHRPDSSSRTILMQAARSGNPSVTVYLLEGVRSGDILHLDPAAVDCRGESALHYGIRSGCGAVVAALLDDGRLRLDTTAFLPPQQQHQSLTNADGRCGGMVVSALPQDPLDVALGDPRLSDVCRLLLDRLPMESGVGRRDCLGRTPLFRFVEHGLIGLLRSYAPGNYRPGWC